MPRKRLQQEAILERFKDIHGDDFDNFWVFYETRTTPVLLVCNNCGYVFRRTPNEHLKGRKCQQCSRKKVGQKLALTTIEFIKRSILVHGYFYGYHRVKYINNWTPVEIWCPIHGYFFQNPSNHFKGVRCAKCEQSSRTKDTSFFKNKSEVIHSGTYNYSNSLYINAQTKVEIICKKHGSFWMLPHNHYAGSGCPKCNESQGEKKIRLFLEEHDLYFISEYRAPGCINPENNSQLRYDFYIEDLNLIIEYDGALHYEAYNHFGGEEALKIRQVLDVIKNKFCSKNKIRLLRIPYWDIERIPELINKEIKETHE